MQQVAFLALESVPVILFDYQGVGETEGEARLDNLDKDAGAVWECVKNSDLIKGRKTCSFRSRRWGRCCASFLPQP